MAFIAWNGLWPIGKPSATPLLIPLFWGAAGNYALLASLRRFGCGSPPVNEGFFLVALLPSYALRLFSGINIEIKVQ
ncbi:hypothetical protein [Pseudozobellia thermophila]|uniref:hypothetical protein n=1 Tax=Pseudozobellia thermophila TaxID=192903 RepID=UPI001114D2F5|nr:hypothetical protein [Pseudozobellia thermophila]